MPVVPDGARHATLNINGVVRRAARRRHPDAVRRRRCRAVFDRRFLLEEGFDRTKAEIDDLLQRAAAEMPELPLQPARPDGGPPGAYAGGFAGGAIGARTSIEQVLGRSGDAGRQPWDLRSQARRPHRRHSRLRRVRSGHTRPGASAGRVVRHRRSGQRHESAGACRFST